MTRSILLFSLISFLLSAQISSAAPVGKLYLEEGVYRGTSSEGKHLNLMVRRSPGSGDRFHAVLAEYLYLYQGTQWIADKIKKAKGEGDGKFLKDVATAIPRMHVYQIERRPGEENYTLRNLQINDSGDLSVQTQPENETLVLQEGPEGALVSIDFQNHDLGSVTFDEKPHSTWENYVKGAYIIGIKGPDRFSVGSYMLRDKIKQNSLVLSTPMNYITALAGKNYSLNRGTAQFFETDRSEATGKLLLENYTGNYDIYESQNTPGFYLFRNASVNATRADELLNRIAVFVDIVNWKTDDRPEGQEQMCTDEMMLINPEDPEDVVIYYERDGSCE